MVNLGSFSKLAVIAVAFIVLGLSLAIGATVTQEVRDTNDFTNILDADNKTFTNVEVNTTQSLDFSDLGGTFILYNTSTGTIIPSSNYTVNTALGTFILPYMTFNFSNLTADYQYNERTEGYNVAANATKALGNMSKFLPLIGLLLIAAILISLVIVSFRRR